MIGDKHTPSLIEGDSGDLYALFLLRLSKCKFCGKPIMRKERDYSGYLFPVDYLNSQTEQLKRLGGVFEGYRSFELNICVECVKEERGEFECLICEVKYPLKELQEEVGCDNQGKLCKTCYKTRTAQEWMESIEKYEDNHEWDCAS